MLSRQPEQQRGIFGELYARYSRKVFLYCRKAMEQDHDARDAFQETWTQFHSAALRSDIVVQNVGGYLFRIARNVCLSKRRSLGTPVMTYDDIYADSNAGNSYEAKEINDLLRRALDVLEPEYREAYVLHELEGFPYEDISRITGETVAALRNRVWRARKHVREFLAPLLS